MPLSKLSELLENKDTANGVRMLLNEIRAHQKDMPPECRDDLTFGALVAIYELSKTREKRIDIMRKAMIAMFVIDMVTVLALISLHLDEPWLTGLLQAIFG